MMKYKLIFPILLASLLVGCGYRNDERYLIKHPQLLQAKVAQCQAIGDTALRDPDCIFAKDVLAHAVKYSAQLTRNSEAFGKNILAAQQQLARFNQQIEQSRGRPEVYSRLIERRDYLNYEINIMLTLVAESEGM